MRAPRTPFRPQPKTPARRRVEGASALVLAVALAAAVIGAGALRAPRSLDPARAPLARTVTVNLGPQDQARLDSWAEFFACHGLVNSEAVMLATLRANGEPWRPDRPIRLELAPSADQPPETPAELAILDQASALANAAPEVRDRACSAHAAPPPPAAIASVTGGPGQPTPEEAP